jgi:hypothetical protein
MNKQELNEKIAEINNSDAPAAEKKSRIDGLNSYYQKQVSAAAEADRQKQEAAEANLKSRLRNAYMVDPAASAESFEADCPSLKSEYLKSEALKADTIAQETSAAAYRQAF